MADTTGSGRAIRQMLHEQGQMQAENERLLRFEADVRAALSGSDTLGAFMDAVEAAVARLRDARSKASGEAHDG